MTDIEKEISRLGWNLEEDKSRRYFRFRASQNNFHTIYREFPEEVLADIKALKEKAQCEHQRNT